MEIIVLPYFAISFAIAWAVFSPFAKVDEMDEWTFSKLRTSDLLAILLPISVFLSVVTWVIPIKELPQWVFAGVIVSALLFAASALWGSLYVLAKLGDLSSSKRVAVIGVLIPLGLFLTLGWISIPLVAYSISMIYSIPAALSIIPATLGLRAMSHWVCGNPVWF